MLQAEVPPVGAGGVGYQVDLLAREMVRRGHDVTLFVTHEPPPGVPYRCVEVGLARTGRLYRMAGTGIAFARLDLGDFDVVHAHGDDWRMGRRTRVRTFYGCALMEARTATTWSRRVAQVGHYCFELMSSIGACGVVISSNTRTWLPLARQVVPCGFDPRIFFADPATIRTTHPSILFVAGRLGGRKRGTLMLDAFAEVRRQLPDARLSIVSRDLVRQPNVDCLSHVPPSTLGDLYRSHWVLCSTSSYEGFGLPYVEALASGLPVVTTTNPGAREVLEDGRLGLLCRPEELAPSLVSLLRRPDERDRMAQRGVEAAGRYQLARVAARYEEIYRVAAGTNRNGACARG